VWQGSTEDEGDIAGGRGQAHVREGLDPRQQHLDRALSGERERETERDRESERLREDGFNF
jgi:hypothetical protein